MKAFLFGFLGVLIAFVVIIIAIYILIRYILNKCGFVGKSLLSIYKESKQANEIEKQRVKNLSGMTKVLLPVIKEDFSDFDESHFYLLVEKCLRNILLALETKDYKYLKDKELNVIRQKIELQIEDLKENDISYKYDDIIFHKHAIKSYKKEKGMALITISTAVEYYYTESKNNNIIKADDYKKQTRYTTSFAYIVDSEVAGFDIGVLGINCPNCGSPVTSFKQKNCHYCKSVLNIQVADLLKCWKIIDYKEDY